MSLLNYIYKFDYSQIIKNVFYYLSITIFEISIKLFENPLMFVKVLYISQKYKFESRLLN